MSNTKKATNPQPLDEGFTIEYAAETYEFTRDDLDDLELLQLIMAGNPFSAVQHLLGDDWARFEGSVRTDKGKVPASKTMEFVKLFDEPLGNFARSLLS